MNKRRARMVIDRIFLLKNDFLRSIKAERKRLLFYAAILLLGVVLGVLIGMRIGEKESPLGVFAALFHMDFAPFSHIFPDLFRFFFFLLLAGLSYFLPFPKLYPSLAMIFFGKYFGQLSYLVFISDSIISALLSLFIVYLPLLLCGGFLLFDIAIHGEDGRLCGGADVCLRSVKGLFRRILLSVLFYFILLVLLYTVVCGILYLIFISL